MKRKLFAAVVALALGGCKRTPPQTITPPIPPRVELPKPVVEVVNEAKSPLVSQSLGLPHDDRVGTNHFARSKDLKSIGELDAALVEARRALFDHADDEDALRQVAKLAEATRDPELAVKALERLAQLGDQDPQPLLKAARIEIASGKNDEALRLAKAALKRDGDNPDSHHVLGRAYLAKGELDSAIQSFKQAIDLVPDHGYALNNLGFAFLRANMNEEAVEVLERAAEVLPNVAYVHNNLGVAYERVGRNEDAELEYSQSTILSPKYVKAQINSARVKKVASKDAPTPSDIEQD